MRNLRRDVQKKNTNNIGVQYELNDIVVIESDVTN